MNFSDYLKTPEEDLKIITDDSDGDFEPSEEVNEKTNCDISVIIDFLKKAGIKYKNLEFIKNGVQLVFFKEDIAENVAEELKIPEFLKCYSIISLGKIISIISNKK